jgi:hypothetical protein
VPGFDIAAPSPNAVEFSRKEGEGKHFFFEKKKQKTFIHYGQHRRRPFGPKAARNGQKFFASFFQKRSACLLFSKA